jgi:CRP-like cAMP-binding protein
VTSLRAELLDSVAGCDAGGLAPLRAELLDRVAEGDAKITGLMSEVITGFRRGQQLVAAGDAHDAVWRLCEGWCIRWRRGPGGRRQILYVYTPADLLVTGSMLLSVQPDTFELLTSASLQQVSQAQLHAAAATDYNLALRLIWQFSEEERHLRNELVRMKQCSAEVRVIDMLVQFEARLERLGMVDGDSFKFPMKQQDIADYMGISSAYVSRILARLRSEGVASFTRGEVRLHNRQRLAGLVRHPWP